MPLLSVNGASLFVDETGPADAPAVVFSNSLGTTLEMWDLQMGALAGRYRCIRYDTRGHGRSPATQDPVTPETLADDLAGLIDALGLDRPVVVGLSLGGITAQGLAIRHPGKARALVLMATAPFLPPRENWLNRAETVTKQGMGVIVDGVMGRWFTPAMAQAGPGRLAFLREKFVAVDPNGYAACCRALADTDWRQYLGSITVPTLVVAGEHDPVTTPAMMRDLANAIPGARFEIVEDSSHIFVAERPAESNALLSAFLEAHAGEPEATSGAAFQRGLATRKAVLGVDHVQRSLEHAGPFTEPWQDFITRNAWGEIWGDPALPWKTRSLVTLSMMVALHREEEFKLHVRPALKNGVTLTELRGLLMQTAIYAGVPAANAAFRWVRDVLGDEIDAVDPLDPRVP